MFKNEPTPGKWQYNEDTNWVWSEGCERNGNDPRICKLTLHDTTPEELKANGHLLAASKELLAALKKVLDNPEKVKRCAASWSLAQKYPVKWVLQERADWYQEILDVVAKAEAATTINASK